MQLFPKIWILEISKKAFRISGSCSRLIAVFGYPYPVANSLSCRISNRQTGWWSSLIRKWLCAGISPVCSTNPVKVSKDAASPLVCTRGAHGLDFDLFGPDSCCFQRDQEWGFLSCSRIRIWFGFCVYWKNVAVGPSINDVTLFWAKIFPLPPCHISSQVFNPPFKYHVTISKSPALCLHYEFPYISCLPRQNFHMFYRFYLCTLWQDQHSNRKTSKIPHTLLSKN